MLQGNNWLHNYNYVNKQNAHSKMKNDECYKTLVLKQKIP